MALLTAVLLAAIFGGLSLGIIGVKWLIYWRHRRAERRYDAFHKRIMDKAASRRLAEAPLPTRVRTVVTKDGKFIPREERVWSLRPGEGFEMFQGKGGASGGAGASGEWAPDYQGPREPVVEAGTFETARAAEARPTPSEEIVAAERAFTPDTNDNEPQQGPDPSPET